MTTSLTLERAELARTTAAQRHRRSVPTVPTIDASQSEEIAAAFERKTPFIIENAGQNPHAVDMDFISERYPELQVTCFNPESNSEHIQLGDLLGGGLAVLERGGVEPTLEVGDAGLAGASSELQLADLVGALVVRFVNTDDDSDEDWDGSYHGQVSGAPKDVEFFQLALGEYTSCGLVRDAEDPAANGTARCWGRDDGPGGEDYNMISGIPAGGPYFVFTVFICFATFVEVRPKGSLAGRW
mgnify:CR=1 FL=1